jgi:hypothetical protein
MTEPTADIARLEQKVDALAADNRALAAKVDGLLEAWNTARGMVRFIKLLGQISLAFAAIWGLFQLGSHK